MDQLARPASVKLSEIETLIQLCGTGIRPVKFFPVSSRRLFTSYGVDTGIIRGMPARADVHHGLYGNIGRRNPGVLLALLHVSITDRDGGQAERLDHAFGFVCRSPSARHRGRPTARVRPRCHRWPADPPSTHRQVSPAHRMAWARSINAALRRSRWRPKETVPAEHTAVDRRIRNPYPSLEPVLDSGDRSRVGRAAHPRAHGCPFPHTDPHADQRRIAIETDKEEAALTLGVMASMVVALPGVAASPGISAKPYPPPSIHLMSRTPWAYEGTLKGSTACCRRE